MRPLRLALTAGLLAVLSSAGADSIPKDKLDDQKVFVGDPKKFSKPAEIRFIALVKSAPEYKTIKQESLKTSDARYWILMTQAQERVAKSITRVAREHKFDLVCEKGTLEPFGIKAPEMTKLVKQNIAGESQSDAQSKDGKHKIETLTEPELETLKSKVRVKVEGD